MGRLVGGGNGQSLPSLWVELKALQVTLGQQPGLCLPLSHALLPYTLCPPAVSWFLVLAWLWGSPKGLVRGEGLESVGQEEAGQRGSPQVEGRGRCVSLRVRSRRGLPDGGLGSTPGPVAALRCLGAGQSAGSLCEPCQEGQGLAAVSQQHACEVAPGSSLDLRLALGAHHSGCWRRAEPSGYFVQPGMLLWDPALEVALVQVAPAEWQLSRPSPVSGGFISCVIKAA